MICIRRIEINTRIRVGRVIRSRVSFMCRGMCIDNGIRIRLRIRICIGVCVLLLVFAFVLLIHVIRIRRRISLNISLILSIRTRRNIIIRPAIIIARELIMCRIISLTIIRVV